MRPSPTMAILAAALAVSLGARAQDRRAATGGDLVIRPLVHASVEISLGDRVVQVDPWSTAGLIGARPADLILVTDADAGGHHLDPAAIRRLRKPGAPVVIPALGRAKVDDGLVLENGQKRTVAGFEVEAIAAYDLTQGDPYHPKGKANGYVLTIGGRRVYVMGVAECVPEIRALRAIDVMFVPMNLPLGRMAPHAAADCLRAIRPRIAYPYHYDIAYQRKPAPTAPAITRTLEELADLVGAWGVEVRVGAWYPAPGPGTGALQ